MAKSPEEQLSVVAIIPLYNGARYIAEAIESVLAQSVRPDEIIVVNDGSDDDGPAIAEKFEPRGVTVLHKENGGQGSARNLGVANSTSDVICFLDQDDLWYPNHVELLLKAYTHALASHQGRELGWAYGNLDEIDENGMFVSERFLDRLGSTHPKTSLEDCLAQDMFVLPGASLVSRTAFDAVGGFDEMFRGYEDDDLFLRIFRLGYRNVYLDKPITQWRIYGGSTSYTPTMARSRVRYFHKLVDEFARDDEELGRDYVQDTIAPRFVFKAAAEYRRALRRSDFRVMDAAVQEMLEVSEYLSPYRRARVRTVLPLMRRHGLARAAMFFPLENRIQRYLS
ncbi:MAG: glycosyltransferase family 2 protein [Aeromicrobium sp.]